MSSADVAAATRLPGARHTIARLYESVVEAHPDAPAITDGSRSWSYRELNAAANRVAWWLIGRGVGPERAVGVALPRGLDQVAALLGTLKAGAVYLPLDPVLPAERIGYLLGDAAPGLVLTDGAGTGFPGAVDIGDPSVVAAWAAHPADDPGDDDRIHALTADHLAYVIYTSGSTGTPKGVGVSHGSAVNLARTVTGQYAPGDTPRVLQLASLGFDVAIWELLTAVATGGTLVVPRAERLVGDDLLRVLREERITCVTLPVPVLASLPADAENQLPDLTTVHIGGETCPPELVRRWSTGRRLINGYGATETTVAATLTAPLTGTRAPIGTPIEHTRVHVLDDALAHLPPGKPGELYVAGANVARGYLRRPGLTATRFLADPYGPPGARMYRTGDVGVRHPDGRLEFLRRADDQVKIRGARVEPGELEAVLRRRADIVDAAVAVRADTRGEQRLVAYVVPSPSGTPSAAELRDELRAALPPSLVPASVVPLDSLPLTPNGKVDRDALPDPRHTPAGLQRTARGPLEDMLRTLFAEILELPGIGFDDDFFDLGGHSLLAGRLIGRIRGALGLHVDMRDFFERPTPAALAAHLQRQEAGPARPELTPLPRPERIPLSYAQARLWFLHRLEGPSATYNMPLVLHLTGVVDTAALAEALADVVRRHEPLRTLFPEIDGQPYQLITDPDEIRPDLPVRRIDAADLDEELRRSARYAFDLARQLPIRAELLVLGPDESVLTLVIHHIAGDGWSGAPLARDLVTAYSARRDDTAPQWLPLPVQYADYTLWQRALLGDENDPAGPLSEQSRYWREQLAELPDEITVPGDRPRPAVATYRGGVVPITLDAELHAAVTELARDNGATVYMVLQATLAALLTRLGAGTDIAIGAGVAGRSEPALDDLVGLFVNMLVLRTDTSGSPRFTELLDRVRDTSLAAYSHQDIPFEQLVESLNPHRSAGRQSLFQVALVLQNNTSVPFDLPGLRVRAETVPTGTARFDLSLSVTESTTPDGTPAGIGGTVEYAADLYDRPTVEAVVERWTRLIRQVVADPGRRIDTLDVITPGDESRLAQWRRDERDVEPLTFSDLFERQAAATPHAVAVSDGADTWTYGELNRHANRVAGRLIDRGIGPEDLVGIAMPRSARLVAALLGVLKAGAAYVPVDLVFPAGRNRHVLTDSAPRLVLTSRAGAEDLPSDLTCELVVVDEDGFTRGRPGREENPTDGDRVRPMDVDNPAYVIYTSGSTGRPKGVVVTHRGLAAFAETLRQRCAADGNSRVLQLSSPSVDASVLEMVWAFTSGARLCIAGQHRLAGDELAQALAEHHITHAHIPPSALSTLAPETAGRLPEFRMLSVGAEACPPELVRLWLPGREFVNAYGPTECTVAASHTFPLTEARAPIGRPVLDAELHVLDTTLRPAAPGVPGELYIGGAGLARGYLGRGGLTASRFVANPFGAPGARMYRTGDVVRWNADGELEYLGRSDEQVKVRGFRVEPGEIERVLASQPSVERAVVVPRRDRSGAVSLAAYTVLAAEATNEGFDDQLSEWNDLYDQVYTGFSGDAGNDFVGWNSSFTGGPIPVEEMRAWQRAAVDAVLRFRPGRVLEIGAGSGLLMAPLADEVDEYWGTDLSQVSVDRLRDFARQRGWDHVRLTCRPAHDLSGLPHHHFDTVVINSVVQYFPSADYLRDVLTRVMDLLADGGRVIVGDVRHYGLLRVFQTAVHDFRGTPGARAAVERAIAVEKELLLAPEFFTSFEHPALSGVEVSLKAGGASTELSGYRYEVVLHTAPARRLADLPVLVWGRDLTDPDQLTGPARVTHIPNPRLADGVAAVRALDGADAVPPTSEPELDPEAVRRWAAAHGMRAVPTWSSQRWNTYDVVLTDAPEAEPLAEVYRPAAAVEQANVPAVARTVGELVSELRSTLKGLLPDYMVPATITPIERIPVTPNGKIDRRALPDPEVMVSDGRRPRTPQEQILCELYADILGLERVGPDDSFFDLGGHSLLATRLTSRIRSVLGVEALLRQIFAAPSPAELAVVLGEGQGRVQTALERMARPELLPLSSAQQRLWFLHRLEGSSATYNSPLAIRLSGALDVVALRAALGDVVGRHEALRTVFAESDGMPYQRVLDTAEVDLPVHEVSEEELPGALREAARYAFDLSREIPLQARLFTTRRDEWVLLLVVHHIAADGWSLGPLARDLTTAYGERAAGRAPSWAPLPVQYADYTLWQRQLLGDDTDPDSTIGRQLAYWRDQLAGLPEQVTLPTDRARPQTASYAGDVCMFRIEADLHADLLALARHSGATLFMVLQAALAAVLTRSGAGTDVPIGSPIAGRTDDALDDLVGFFVNTLVLRTDTSGNPEFDELLRRVRDTSLAAYAHQDVPFEYLVEKLNPQRSTAHSPLFQVLLAFQNNPETSFDLPGLRAEPDEIVTGVSRVDLTLNITETFGGDGSPQGIRGAVEYATDLYDASTVESFTARLVRMLRTAVEDPGRRINGVDLLSDEETATVLALSGRDTEAPGQLVWPSVFEATASATPDATAVVEGDLSWSYAELNAHANRIARYLIGRGVGAEDIVGVLMPRSATQIATLLGIGKAGAAFLPIDPAYPAERVGYLVADAGPKLLLTDTAHADTAAGSAATTTAFARIDTITVDDPALASALRDLPATDPTDADRRTALRVEHPAYVIYTSGSTGRPKGTVVTHSGLSALAVSGGERADIDRGSRVLQLTSPSFDVSVFEFLTTFHAGAVLVMPQPGRLSGEELAAILAGAGVSHAFVPPSVLATLPDDAADGLPGLRSLVVGGEACSAELVRRWSVGRRMTNLYGPTETTVAASVSRPLSGSAHPIGAPLAGTRVYVLDAGLGLVPRGSRGELYIAGAGVARGYLGRFGLTASRFVADPYGPPGSRMYRTGDVVRWNADGELEYLGRSDHQLKIRGIRVEPGEVEAALLRQPGVSRAVVVARPDQHGFQTLYAYVTTGEEPADAARLREELRRELPDYLVPAAVVVLGEFPLTPNGKLDRDALPLPRPVTTGVDDRSPGTPQEEILRSVFADVLGITRVGAEDNFFDLGGHSLLAGRLISRIRGTLGVDVSMRTFFNAPTPRRLADRLVEGGPVPARLRPMPRPEVLPLSFAQQRLWFLHKLEGPSATYNSPLAIRLSGDLDVPALREALADVVARHEALRTVFAEQGATPCQRILDVAEAVPGLEIRETTEEELPQALREAARYEFDLAHEIPLRAWLFTTGPGEWALTLVLHHIVADGWSLQVLVSDLTAAYTGRRAGTAPSWRPLAVQYADYTLWQREHLGTDDDPGSVFSRQVAYWLEELADLPDQMTLPTDRPRPAVAGYHGETVTFDLDAEQHDQLVHLARETGTTLFMILQTGLAGVLTRLGAGTDIAVGSPIAGRTDDRLEDLVGLFVNMLVLRTDTAGDPTLRDLLTRVRETSLAAYAHQHMPFEYLVERLNPHRSAAHHPLVQILFGLQNTAKQNIDLPGVTASGTSIDTGVSRVDLSINIVEAAAPDGSAAGLTGVLEFSTDLYDRSTIEAFTARWVRVLQAMVTTPGARLSEVDLLAADERARLLEQWGTATTDTDTATLAELFERRVTATPDAVAVVEGDLSWSYAQLNAHANRVARYLIERGVGAEDVVGVLMPRGARQIAAVLGVTKAGAAFLPIDPAYPQARVDYLLRDAEPALVIDESDSFEGLPDHDLGDGDRVRPVTVDHPAYVIYTSGSTGMPKGVVVTHRGLASLAATQRRLGAGEGSRVLQFAALGFDATVWELVMTLGSGATLVLPETDRLAGEDLAAVLREQRVTHLTLPPTVLATLPAEAAAHLPDLHTLVVAGEACTPELTARWSPGRRMVNAYGPTESTVCASMSGELSPGSPPIGGPVANTRLYVLDESLGLVAPGVPGELYIAGEGLARGYGRRPALTASRFLADPYGPAGTRMYRTGDLVRWNTDGELDYLGRTDEQVKIRGFRVEPGEVASALLRHPAVAQAAVIVRPGPDDDLQLLAYAVPAAGRVLDGGELRAWSQHELPEHLVPSAVVVLDEIPRTAHGKIDERALPDPEQTGGRTRAPRTPQEELLCLLFAQVLDVPQVGPDDSFFDLGGHSLLATRLIIRIRKTFHCELAPRALFTAPSPAELAVVLGEGQGRVQTALERMARPELLPLSSAQQRLWFLHRLEGPSATYNSPLAIRLSGALDVMALRAALGDVVGRHEALRTVFAESDGVPYQRVLDTAEVDLPVHEVSEEELPGALREAARYAFDLSREIPLQARLFTTGPDEWVLLLVVHHIAADGWSLGPLARDLAKAYTDRRAGHGPSWTPLPVQYADYTLWQRQLLGDDTDPDSVTGRQLTYWRDQLDGLPEQVTLPTDRPRPQAASYAGDVHMFRIEADLHADLLALARHSGATLFMVLQAALAAVLTRSGAGTDVPIGSPIAGRTDDALDDLVGFFVNTLVLRTDTSGNPEFDELLHRVRDTSLAAYAHQDVPFEYLVEKLNPHRSTAHSPLFQVLLAFQNNPETSFELPGLRTRMEGVSTGLSRVDLFISLAEQQDADGAAGVIGAVEYATDLYDAATIDAFIGRWLRFLAAVALDQGQRIGSVDLLLDGERDQLTGWASTEPTVRPTTLTQLFERRVTATPDATAVVEGDVSWSYAQLNAHANRVAWHLIGRGVGAEDIVGVLMPRSATQIATLLGIGKAGAAYLPIDPTYPQARVEYLLRDAEPALVIDDSEVFEGLPEHDPGDENRVRPVHVDNPAYVIYTSGSTGLPKGVVVTHRGLAALAAGTGERTDVDSDSRVLLLASPSFDASVLELMMAIGAGAALVVAREKRLAGEELAALLAGAGVSHAFVPPSVLATLPDDAADALPGLRSLIVGGEACSAELVRRWSVGRRMTNLYGPTETTVAASVSRPLSGSAHPIGAPLAGTRVYVLDAGLGLVPRGSRGELYIAGTGVARGYLGRFGLTASRFVADPYGPSGSRMYRTGDIVRWNADGELEYLGRSDHQLQIRGIRVEPGEVEATLAAHPDVARAAVVVRGDRRGDPALVGYLVPARPGVDSAAVREDLRRLLPDHLVPAALMALPEFPLTPNGKIDHEALPEPDFATSGGREPRTPEEEILCGLFAEILGLDRVGVEDSFFDLGGHSLLGTRLISRIRAELGIEVRLLTLFEASTPAALARAVLEANSPARAALVTLPRPEVLPLSFAQQRLWFLHKLEGPSPTYNMPFTLRLTGPLQVPALRLALTDVVARHEALRTVFGEHDGAPYQRILDMAEVTIQLPVREADVAALDEEVRDAARHRFDLAAEIPLRASLFVVGHDEWVLTLVLHHIVADGWSLRPLARDLAAAYAAREAGRAPEWSPLPVQYADYSLWHRELLGDDTDPDSEFGRQLAFWRERLAGLPEQVTLPTDRPRPAVASYQGDVSTFQVDHGLHDELMALARQTGSTLFMVLQAALSALLTRSGAGTDVVVGAGVAGRTDEQLDDLVGFFVNMVVLRTDTSDDPTFAELLQRVRDTSLAAYAHQDIPFEYLVEKINPLRSASHQSLFQIAMVLQNNAEADFTLSDLRVRQEGQGTGTSRFDLSLSLTETTSSDGSAAGLTGVVEFSTDLYDRSTIEAFTARWVRVLQAMVTTPGARLSEVDLLGPDERARLLDQWGTAKTDTDTVTLAELFERRVTATPDATAVVEGDLSWSYAQLNAHANRVTRYLIERGVGAEDVVGVLMPRGARQIAAVLGVAKAGAAYLPIDPAYPQARVEYLLRDAEPALVIDESESFDGLPDHDPDDADLVRPVTVDHPAYVIYTSGSTGMPKGVVVTHRGLASLAATLRQRCAADGDSRIMQFSSPSFDASVLELVWALDSGAALVIASADRLAGEELARALADHRITHALIPPSVLSTLPPGAPGDLTGFRALVVGAEACPPELLRSWSPGRRVVNAYGPTESTVVASQTGDLTEPPVPIGTPALNTRLYVLDESLGLVAPGVPGELYIAGEGLARGYGRRPALTASRFVADPYGPAGTRMYRTGDLVRWNTHGELEYLGRTDEQVKIRGFRVEPGEVERVLAAQPSVARAVVVPREDRSGALSLAAYVVPADGGTTADFDGQLDEWRSIYHEVYRGLPREPGADFEGWNSSFTGAPIPIDQMREWQRSAVEQVARFGPRRVLEIGAGSGLVMIPLVERTEEYWATDFSSAAVDRLREYARDRHWEHVHLRCRPAHDMSELPRGHFDVVVLNSVVQYFPSAGYLRDVLGKAVDLLADGGRIVVGDVRHHGLLRALHAAVQGFRYPGSGASAVDHAVAVEKELLLAPEFFTSFRHPRLTGVEVLLKRGDADNELTAYRYEVVLHTGATRPVGDLPELVWGRDVTALDELTAPARVTGIPNPRLADPADPRLHPERIRRWAAGRGWRAVPTWSPRDQDAYDVVLLADISDDAPLADVYRPGSPEAVANVPSLARNAGEFVSGLRATVKALLPDHMVPATITPIERVPLTPNGKIDRRALPEPGFMTTGGEDRGPRDPYEEILCELFADLLGLPRVGVDDGFFDLGGHSLLATRLTSRIRAVLGIEVPLRQVFAASSPARLAAALARGAGPDGTVPALGPEPRPEVLPLSYAQQRLWFLHKLEGPSATYNSPLAIRLSGALDVAAMRSALGDVVARHEALRTVFAEHRGVPHQRVLDAGDVDLPVREVSEDDLTRVLREASRHEFDLAREIPLRARLFTTGPDEWVLLLVVHHIAADGWSLRPLARDLTTAYGERAAGRTPSWAPLPVQYADYALWQRRMLGDDTDPDSTIGRQLAYWREQLAGLPRLVTLPTDRPRPKESGNQGATLTRTLDADLHQALRDLARDNGATLFMTLQAALGAQLTRSGAGTDIPVGAPIAGRVDDALDDLIGFFVNTLVLRIDTSGGPGFVQLLERVRDTSLAAYAHQDIPFDHLVEKLNPDRSAAHHPLFQVQLALQNTPEAEFELAGLTARPQLDGVETGVARVDLTVNAIETFDETGAPAGLILAAEYATDLYDAATIDGFLDAFGTLLREVADSPHQPIGGLDVTSGAEVHIADPVPGTLPRLFETWATADPSAIAVTDGTTDLTYAELNSRANRMARALIDRGVGPEDLVAVLLPRGLPQIVTVLAIAKSGAAYLPIDPAYPADRVAYLCADARPGLVVTDASGAARLGDRQPVFDIDDPATVVRWEGMPDTNPTDRDRSAALGPHHPAYVIYTSGSTGRPKGAVITHAGLADAADAWRDRWGFGPGSRVLQLSSPSFDASVMELVVAFAAHGTLVLPEPGLLAGEALARVLAEQRITHLVTLPSVLASLPADAPGRLTALRGLLLGGEVLTPDLAARWSPGRRMINVYGQTETTVACTMTDPLNVADGARVTVGRPNSGTRVYVLDENLRMVPPGTDGELYVAGPAVGRGYLHRPGLTAGRFVADPYGPAGSRMYRTGDIGRLNHAFELEYVGRTDDQVKIRGVRVEPGEVEAALVKHPAVARAAVVVRADHRGDAALFGYVVPARPDADVTGIREDLRRSLPEHLVPAVVTAVEDFPLTPNGKVDREALPTPRIAAPMGRGPRTPQEEILCGLFAEVLNLGQIGVEDNFFDLGGHSLLANQLIARIAEVMGTEVPIRAFFAGPTVAQLAEHLGSDGTDRAFDVLLPLRTGGTLPPLFCVHPGAAICWSYSDLLLRLSPDFPVYGLQSRALSHPDELPETLIEVADHCIEEMRQVQKTGPYYLLGQSFGGVVAHAMAARLEAAGERVGLIVALDSEPARPLTEEEQRQVVEATAKVYTGILEVLGIDPAAMPSGELTFAQFSELARTTNTVLGNVAEDEFQLLMEILHRNIAIATRHRPERVDADMLIFGATEERERVLDPEVWRDYVAGEITYHPIPTGHSTIMTPEALELIGPVLEEHLRAVIARNTTTKEEN
ncbi:non-ribosomal peptide synthase/polyketide synthase [Streptomyces sp. L500]